jgi:hypothetical protein
MFFGMGENASGSERTSTDIYCESMTLALYESLLGYQPPKTPEVAKRVDNAQAETLEACKAMPTIGAAEKRVKDMTLEETFLIGCVGMAEGMFMAQADTTENGFTYTELTKNRKFIAKACITSKKRFLNDLKTRGPKYVLRNIY